jgi:hypothetical protein
MLLFSAACAHSAGARRSPDFDSHIAGIHKAAFLAPEVKAFEISAGGVPEEKEQWTAVSKSNAAHAVRTGFKSLGIEVQPLDAGASPDEVEEVRTLSEAVFVSVLDYTYSTPFPEKVKRFEYSVGSVSPLLDRAGADALVLVWGAGFAPTFGRHVLNVLVGGPPQQARLAVALVDRAGTILWFNYAHAAGSAGTLTDPEAADAMAKTLLAEFPAQKR